MFLFVKVFFFSELSDDYSSSSLTKVASETSLKSENQESNKDFEMPEEKTKFDSELTSEGALEEHDILQGSKEELVGKEAYEIPDILETNPSTLVEQDKETCEKIKEIIQDISTHNLSQLEIPLKDRQFALVFPLRYEDQTTKPPANDFKLIDRILLRTKKLENVPDSIAELVRLYVPEEMLDTTLSEIKETLVQKTKDYFGELTDPRFQIWFTFFQSDFTELLVTISLDPLTKSPELPYMTTASLLKKLHETEAQTFEKEEQQQQTEDVLENDLGEHNQPKHHKYFIVEEEFTIVASDKKAAFKNLVDKFKAQSEYDKEVFDRMKEKSSKAEKQPTTPTNQKPLATNNKLLADPTPLLSEIKETDEPNLHFYKVDESSKSFKLAWVDLYLNTDRMTKLGSRMKNKPNIEYLKKLAETCKAEILENKENLTPALQTERLFELKLLETKLSLIEERSKLIN